MYCEGYKTQIEAYIEAHRKEFFVDLKEMIAIDSKNGEALPGMPYGMGPALALGKMLKKAESYGLYTENWENHLGIVQLHQGTERQLDIFAHLDIVPAGEGWMKTDPFVMKEEDGLVYGRGTADDKGPALAALYAMRAVKDLDLPVKKEVRLILGCDEEMGGRDLDCYFGKTDFAPMSFSPDAEYPVINIEKGGFFGDMTSQVGKPDDLPKIHFIHGGIAENVVPSTCEALIVGISLAEMREIVEEVGISTGAEFFAEQAGVTEEKLDGEGEVVRVYSKGVSAHASTPEKGCNAVTAMLTLLTKLPLAHSDCVERLRTLAELFPHGDYYGKAAGVLAEDALSGKLTISLNTIHLENGLLTASFDSRTPLSAKKEKLEALGECLTAAGFHCDIAIGQPHHVPEESVLVQSLLKSYEAYSGKKGRCVAMGGGTYVHSVPNGVAFGCADLEIDNHMHGPDEFADMDMLMMSCKIFADAILRLC